MAGPRVPDLDITWLVLSAALFGALLIATIAIVQLARRPGRWRALGDAATPDAIGSLARGQLVAVGQIALGLVALVCGLADEQIAISGALGGVIALGVLDHRCATRELARARRLPMAIARR